MPDAHDPTKRHAPMMLTTDLALRARPGVRRRSPSGSTSTPTQFADAFARAWFKLTHRDMGPVSRYLGPEVPAEELIWQDPVPAAGHALIDGRRRRRAEGARSSASGLSGAAARRAPPGRRRRRSAAPTSAAGRTVRASAWRRRRTGRRTIPPSWPRCWPTLEQDPGATSTCAGGKQVSLADLIVLGGCAAVEQAAKDGRARRRRCRSARAARTRRRSRPTSSRSPSSSRRPTASATTWPPATKRPAEELLVDRANMLTLTAPEMTVLVGGLRVLGANTAAPARRRSPIGPGTLTNDFFVNLLDMGTEWKPSADRRGRLRGHATARRGAPVDRHGRRPGLRVELAAAGPRRGVRQRRRPGEVRPRLRGRLGQGDEPGPLRPGLICTPHGTTFVAWCRAAATRSADRAPVRRRLAADRAAVAPGRCRRCTTCSGCTATRCAWSRSTTPRSSSRSCPTPSPSASSGCCAGCTTTACRRPRWSASSPGAADDDGADGLLITRHIDYSLPYRALLSGRGLRIPYLGERLLDALAGLLVRLHLGGLLLGRLLAVQHPVPPRRRCARRLRDRRRDRPSCTRR